MPRTFETFASIDASTGELGFNYYNDNPDVRGATVVALFFLSTGPTSGVPNVSDNRFVPARNTRLIGVPPPPGVSSCKVFARVF